MNTNISSILKLPLALWLMGAFLGITETSLGQAKMKFEKKTQKFPKTKAGKLLSFEYQLTNTGDVPLIINELKVACTCTKFKFDSSPISPNQASTIYVTSDTHNKIGYQDRIIEVYSNALSSPHKLRFKGMVDHQSK